MVDYFSRHLGFLQEQLIEGAVAYDVQFRRIGSQSFLCTDNTGRTDIRYRGSGETGCAETAKALVDKLNTIIYDEVTPDSQIERVRVRFYNSNGSYEASRTIKVEGAEEYAEEKRQMLPSNRLLELSTGMAQQSFVVAQESAQKMVRYLGEENQSLRKQNNELQTTILNLIGQNVKLNKQLGKAWKKLGKAGYEEDSNTELLKVALKGLGPAAPALISAVANGISVAAKDGVQAGIAEFGPAFSRELQKLCADETQPQKQIEEKKAATL